MSKGPLWGALSLAEQSLRSFPLPRLLPSMVEEKETKDRSGEAVTGNEVFAAPANVSSQDCSEKPDEGTVGVDSDDKEDDYLPFNHGKRSLRRDGLNRQSHWDPEPREWILSTTAPYHATPDRGSFDRHVSVCTSSVAVQLSGYEDRRPVLGFGTMKIDVMGTPQDTVPTTITLRDVLHIPSFPSSLISASSTLREGYTMSMELGHAQILRFDKPICCFRKLCDAYMLRQYTPVEQASEEGAVFAMAFDMSLENRSNIEPVKEALRKFKTSDDSNVATTKRKRPRTNILYGSHRDRSGKWDKLLGLDTSFKVAEDRASDRLKSRAWPLRNASVTRGATATGE